MSVEDVDEETKNNINLWMPEVGKEDIEEAGKGKEEEEEAQVLTSPPTIQIRRNTLQISH